MLHNLPPMDAWPVNLCAQVSLMLIDMLHNLGMLLYESHSMGPQ